MIYCFCDQCGLAFRKGREKNPNCLRCGSKKIWENDVSPESLTLSDQIADKILKERARREGRA